MTDDDLKRANNIKKEISELENFLFVAEKVWKGKILKRTSQYILKSVPFGVFGEVEFVMNNEIKNRVLGVLRDKLSELKKELADI